MITPEATTKLLLHFEGIDGATTDIDEVGRHVYSFNNLAQLDTAQKYFGDSSLRINGATDNVEIKNNQSDWNFSNNDFTIDYLNEEFKVLNGKHILYRKLYC